MATKSIDALEERVLTLIERVTALEAALATATSRLDKASGVISALRAQRETAVAAPAKKSTPNAVAEADRIDRKDFLFALGLLQGANPGRKFKSKEVVDHFRALQTMAAAAATAAKAEPQDKPVAEVDAEDVDF
jgi:hypothetical protein